MKWQYYLAIFLLLVAIGMAVAPLFLTYDTVAADPKATPPTTTATTKFSSLQIGLFVGAGIFALLAIIIGVWGLMAKSNP